jgi:hypothetical protein
VKKIPRRRNRSSGADGGGELAQDRHGHVPAHAGVGDALADGEAAAVGEILAAVHEKTLEHDADDAGFSGRTSKSLIRRQIRLSMKKFSATRLYFFQRCVGYDKKGKSKPEAVDGGESPENL